MGGGDRDMGGLSSRLPLQCITRGLRAAARIKNIDFFFITHSVWSSREKNFSGGLSGYRKGSKMDRREMLLFLSFRG